eukprot:522035_1
MTQNKKQLYDKLQQGIIMGEQLEDNEWIYQDEVDFQAVVSTSDGLLAFLKFLAHEEQLNYLLFSMEATQYKEYAIPVLLRKYKQFVQELEDSMIKFPPTIPDSTIIYPGLDKPPNERTIFIALYQKYVDQSANFPIKISLNLTNEATTLCRRECNVYHTNKYENSNATDYQNAPNILSTMKTKHTEITESETAGFKVAVNDVKTMIEALDGILDDVISTLQKSFAKYQQTEEFSVWFAHLKPHDLDTITREFRHRQLVNDSIIKRENKIQCKRWTCDNCTLRNREIYVDNRIRIPNSICVCCGDNQNELNVDMPSQSSHLSVHKMNYSAKHDTIDSIDSFTTEFKEEELHEIIAPSDAHVGGNNAYASVEVQLDKNVVKEWKQILEIVQNKECDGLNINSCPQIQKIHFVMKCYHHYLGKVCKCAEEKSNQNPNSQRVEYNIVSMSELVNNLEGLNLRQLLDMYQHIDGNRETVHFVTDIFEYFKATLGKCDVCGQYKDFNAENRTTAEETEANEVDDGKNGIGDLDNNGKRETDEERITLFHLEKWHSFLFHANVKHKKNIIVEDDSKEVKEQESSRTVLNIIVEDDSKEVKEHESSGTVLNIFVDSDQTEELYYEYGFGKHIEYHKFAPHFSCMIDELFCNEMHTISESVWNDILAKTLLFLEMESIQQNYRSNDHENAKQYGIEEGELIGVDNVIAILLFCNFDDLQRKFSQTWRKIEENDTDASIIDRHCKNFYWTGRALYVAINFYGQRMDPNQVVWHGVSSKMLFDNFAAYFDCPTSTTTQKSIAQAFSDNGNGIILKLKSKHNNNCAWMLDVSVFSDYTDECERL